MKILVIPDIHGNWEEVIPKINNYDLSDIDKVVVLGDYVDDFTEALNGKIMIEGFTKLCNLKRKNPDKFIILMGNHDLSYLSSQRCSGYHWQYDADYRKMFLSNIDIVDIACKLDDWVFSHAGLTKSWVEKWVPEELPEETFYKAITKEEWLNAKDEIGRANLLLHAGQFDVFGYDNCSNGTDFWGTGDEITQGPVWVRPTALMKDPAFPNQIVGHTEATESPLLVKNSKLKLIITDSREHNKFYLLDTSNPPTNFRDK